MEPGVERQMATGAADPLLSLVRVLLQPLVYHELAQAVVDAVPAAFAPETGVLGTLFLTIHAETHSVEAFTYTHGPHHTDIARGLNGRPLYLLRGDYRRESNLIEQVAAQKTMIAAPHLRDFLTGYCDEALLDQLEQLIGWRGGLALPVPVQQRSAGVLLYALGKDSLALSETERGAMTNVANLVGLALEQARLYEVERRRTREAEALHSVFLRIATTDDTRAMVEEILTAALQLLGADYAAVNTIPSRPGEQAWSVRRGYRSPAEVISTVYPSGTGLAGRAMQNRTAVVVQEFGVDPAFPPAEFPVHVAEGMQSGMGVPLLRPTAESGGSGEAFGALVVGYRERYRIGQDQVDVAVTLAQQAAAALERSRLLAMERHRAAELEALVVSGHQLTAEINQGAVLRSIAAAATDTLGATGAAVAVVNWSAGSDQDPASAQLEFREWYQDQVWRSPEQVLQRVEVAARRALAFGEIQIVAPAEALIAGERHATDDAPPTGMIALPIRSRGGIPAVVVLLGKRDGHPFDDDDRRLLRAFAEQAASALENARLYEEERRARRELEQAQEQGQAFLRIVAHDLKTPLTNILGYAQLAQRLSGRLMALWSGSPNDVGDPLRGALDKIVDNCRRLQRLVDDLQEAFRLGSGRFELQRAPFDLAALTRQIVDEQQVVATDHQFNVSLPRQPLVGHWDAERLRQIIANLVSNAVKYSPDGGAIALTLRRHEDTAMLTVADKGLGIPAADLPSLFQPYSRLHQSRHIKGTGLGLYIVKGIVEAHGGSVYASSPGEGAGATFTIALPLTPPSEPATLSGNRISAPSLPHSPSVIDQPSSAASL